MRSREARKQVRSADLYYLLEIDRRTRDCVRHTWA